MRRVFAAAVLTGALCTGWTAAAQTPTPAAPKPMAPMSGPLGGRLFIGGIAGGGAVQKIGGLAGGEIGFEVTEGLDVYGEGLWIQNVATRRRLDLAQIISTSLQASQGKTATSDVVAEAGYGGAGVRLMLTNHGTIRPYATFSVGAAHITPKPTFTLGGTDITSSLSTYGVTLGSDVTGEITKPAIGGGVGVRAWQGKLYFDGGLRVISIRTPDQPTNVLRVSGAVGMKF